MGKQSRVRCGSAVRLGLLIGLLIVTGVSAATPFELKIIQPAPSLDENNRYYRAYPGLEYSVRVSVVGGAYPYSYKIVGPAGMSIDQRGEIKWVPSQNEEATYSAQVSVVDSENVSTSVSWTIKVTKDKFLFVDAVHGRVGGSGTIDDPMKAFADVYGGTDYAAKYGEKNRDHFVYFKTGVYELAGYSSDGYQIQYTYRQPVVLMAFPGQAPRLDMSKNCLRFDTSTDNLYVEGLDVSPISGPDDKRFGFRVVGSSKHVTFRKNRFHELTATTGSYNQSAIMAAETTERGHSWAIQDNEFYNIRHGYGIIGYTIHDVLVENNRFYDIEDPTGTSAHPIGPKLGTSRWFIRGNDIRDVKANGIWLYYASGQSALYGDMDVSFNYVSMIEGNALSINQSAASVGASAYVYRNTFVGNILVRSLTAEHGVKSFYNNIIINSSSPAVSCASCSAPERLVLENNLFGSVGDGIIDDEGRLTEPYLEYLDVMGRQVGSAGVPPAPPRLEVQ